MEVRYNERTKKIEFKFSEDDLADYRRIKELTDEEAWKTLVKYHALAREEIIESGKNCSRVRVKRDLCSERFAMLDGFDQWVLITQKIVNDYDNYVRTELEQKQEEKNETED